MELPKAELHGSIHIIIVAHVFVPLNDQHNVVFWIAQLHLCIVNKVDRCSFISSIKLHNVHNTYVGQQHCLYHDIL